MLVNEHKKLGLDITPIGFVNEEISMSGLDESFDKAAKMKYNVIFPSGKEIDYIPMIDYQVSETETINEVDVIKRAVEQDKKNPLKHVTIFYFYSPPGLGKTVLGAYLAKIYNCPYQIVNCVSSMIDLDLLGNHVLLNDRSVWQDGPIPAIIRATNEYGMGILILNELNALTVNAQMALNPLMDKQECVVLTQNNNEVVKVNDNAHLIIFASMNPDVMGINDLQDSVRDRASAIFNWTYPSVAKETKLVMKLTGLKKMYASKFCKVIAECRKAKLKDNTISKAPSTRALLDWINYSFVWGAKLAFELTIANRYGAGVSPEDIEVLIRIAKGKGVWEWNVDETWLKSSSSHKKIDLNPDLTEEEKRLVYKFKEETGKNAIWRGKKTKAFISWLEKRGS